MSSKFKAFTLSEVLITLGIIAVVAALTLPTIIEKHREQVTVTKVNQTYNILQNAIKQMIIDKGCELDECWGDYPIEVFGEELPKYVKVLRIKQKGNYKIYSLSNGMYVKLYFEKRPIGNIYQQCNMRTNYTGGSQTIYFSKCSNFIDIMLNENSTSEGVELFRFYLVVDGIIPEGMPRETGVSSLKKCLDNFPGFGTACTGWVIVNKNMDYLHCRSELSWNGKNSCK
jgi:prepilin-type N-terminal cleavage/methylation domain-containing protein